MTTIAGMDLGHGSQVKVVRTNFLVVNADNTKAGTAQANANFLNMYNYQVNNLAGGNSGLTCDYIISAADNGSGAPTATTLASGTDPSVVDLTVSNLVHLMGPSRGSLSQQAGLGASSDEAAHIGTSANGKVLTVLSVGLLAFTGTTFAAAAATVDTLGGTGGLAQLMNSNLLQDMAGTTASTSGSEISAGMVPYVDLTEAATDLLATIVGDPGLDLTNVAFTTGYVPHGRADGSAPSEISVLAGTAATKVISNSSGIISVVALMRTGQ